MGKKRQSVAERNLDRQRKHELTLSLLDALKKDPELKYYLGVAAGAGMAAFGSLFSELGGPAASGKVVGSNTTPAQPSASIPDWAFLISPGLMASPLALPNWMKWSSGDGAKATDPFDIIGGVLALGGTGFAGFCAMVLILKAMFGEGGMAEVLKGIGGIVPG